MSGRVRRRVEDEAAQEEAWTLDNYEWDPQACTARKKRMLAPGLAGANIGLTDSPYDLGQDLLPSAVSAAATGQSLLSLTALAAKPELDPSDPTLAGLPVLETADRADLELATHCEVLGCGVSLEGLKRYYVRMRVCEKHLNAPAIVVNGVISRFCQQCARFQFVGEFAGSKKSCIATLERHNARHRAKVLARQQEAALAEEGGRRGGGGARAKGAKSAKAAAGAAGAKRRGTEGAAAATAAVQGMPPCDGALPRPLGSSDMSADGVDDVSVARQQQLAAELAAAPAKPASPHYYPVGWDGAANANDPNIKSDAIHPGAPPAALRPLVTTGGSGLAMAGERSGSGPLAAAASVGLGAPALAALQPQPGGHGLPPQHPAGWGAVAVPVTGGQGFSGAHAAPVPFEQRYSAMVHQQHYLMGHVRTAAAGGGGQPLLVAAPPPPHDVQRAMAAVPPQLLQPAAASPTSASAMAGAAARPFSMPQEVAAYGTHGAGAVSGGGNLYGVQQPQPVHMRRDDSFSNGNTPVGSNAVGGGGGSGPTSDSSGAHSQATARQALLADAGRAASVGATHSDATRSAASGGGGAGAAAMTAASPGTTSSADQLPVARGSATGSGSGAGGAVAFQGAGPVHVISARINSIMDELCPLIAQFKQQAPHGNVGSGLATAAGALPPVLDAAVVMMQEASQLAAALPQAPSWAGAAAPPARPPSATAAYGGYGRQMPQAGPPPPYHSELYQAQGPAGLPVWRSLTSHPGVVINGAAVAQAQAQPYAPSGAAGLRYAPPPQQAPQQQHTGYVAAQPPAPAPMLNGPPPRLGDGGGGYFAPASSDSTAATAACGGVGGPPVYDQHVHTHQHSQYGARPTSELPASGPPATLGGDGGEGEDELLGQLLAFLEEPSDSEQLARQQLQQQQYRNMAAAAQQAVGQHHAAMASLPYGAPLRPLMWQPAPPAPGYGPGAAAAEGGGMHVPYAAGQQQQQGMLPQPPHHGMADGVMAAASGVGGIPEAASDDVDPRELTRVSLKAMNVLPHELPPSLRANLRRWLKEARAEALQATLRPGCLQLVVDVLRPADGPGAPPAPEGELASLLLMPHDPEQAAADVFRILGQRLRDTYVQVDRHVLQIRVGERPVVLSWEEAAEDGGLDGAKYPAIKGCSAAAVCAGSSATIQLSGGNLAHPRARAFARLRGHDLPAALLPPSAPMATAAAESDDGSCARVSVAVPAGAVGLMAVEVGVGHLLGDWWPLLVLPRGCEGAAEELGRLQATAQERQEAARGFRRLLSELASVLETLADAKAAAAAAAAAAADAAASTAAAISSPTSTAAAGAAAAAAAAAAAHSGSNGGDGAHGNGRSSSPGSPGSHSDGSTAPASASGWIYSGGADSLASSAVGSTLNSLATRSTGHPAAAVGSAAARMLPGGHHAAGGAPGLAAAPRPAAASSPEGRSAAGVAPAVAPPPPPAVVRRALGRAARLLRYSVARGLPHLSALLLATAAGLADSPSVTAAAAGTDGAGTAKPSAAAALAALGVDPQSLLPLAVLSGSGRVVDVLAAFAAEVLGEPIRLDAPQGPGGMSALHLAALLPDGGALSRHLLASQPWAAWACLALGWQPNMGTSPPASTPAELSPSTTADGAKPIPQPYGATKGDGGEQEEAEEEEEDGEEEHVVLPPRPAARLTPGSLSVLLGNRDTVRTAVRVLAEGAAAEARARAAEAEAGVAMAAAGAASAALASAVEAWGRTGAVLLSALCEQLGRQSL